MRQAAMHPDAAMTESQNPDTRAAAFRKVREAHQTEMAEDYVELIGDLIARFGEARLTDLAEHTGVTLATASKVVQRLSREGLVQNRPYRSLFLTPAGEELARVARERHGIVQDFLLAIGVDPATAALDSEGIEHHVSETTLARLKALTAQLADQRPPGGNLSSR
ncbi:manganese-binding transcriptional regulator MntR [Sphingomonas carotinifaciens]|uniref:manganese-binding transcriptional regulator MntR n=1 Tax=Sphingomonas carotinifaciens TaxID=1166323 RepID=UPI0039A3B7BF